MMHVERISDMDARLEKVIQMIDTEIAYSKRKREFCDDKDESFWNGRINGLAHAKRFAETMLHAERIPDHEPQNV